MAVLTPLRLQNREYNDIILYTVVPKADGDIAYFIYPPAGVTRYGVGRSSIQVNLGGATSVSVEWGLFDITSLTKYVADQKLDTPTDSYPEPVFVPVTENPITEDTILQLEAPYSALKVEFTGEVTAETFVTVGVT